MLIDCNYLNSTRIAADYLTGQGEIGSFFAYPGYSFPWIKQHNSLIDREQADRHASGRRDKLADTLAVYNQKLGCSTKTLENIQKLRCPQTKAVVTGQQAVLLTGAAFVIYKAMTAILLALKLEEELNCPVVPVFWIASEDHDFLEINNCSFFDEKGRLEKYSITNPLPGLPPVGAIPVGENILELLDRLRYRFANQDVRNLVAQIKEMARDAGNLADFYGMVMNLFFNRYGLIFINPMLPGVRLLVKPLGERVFDCFAEIAEEIESSAAAFKIKGYEPVFLGEKGGQFPMFVEVNGQREPIFISDSSAVIGKQSPVSLSYQKLRQNYLEDPTKFSPNAYLRPVVQDYLLPTIAFVAGPGEINYLAQLQGIYKILGVKMPVTFPRARITLISEESCAILNKIGLAFPLEQDRVNAYKEKLLLDKDRDGLFADLQRFRSLVSHEHEMLARKINAYEPALQKLTDKNLGKIVYQIDYLEDKVWQAFKKRSKNDLQQLDKIYYLLHPRGKEQEMTVNIFSLLDLFGGNLVEKLMGLDILSNTHQHKLVVI